ncbi:MAG: ABC transporter permease subunit [Proteobacteria bacterium]|nr:ABC transporter permease subunit [Pseudomonadota bacterium]
MFLISLPIELFCHSDPLLVKYKGEFFFPLLKTYKATDFGGYALGSPDYKALQSEIESHGFMIVPVIWWGSNETNMKPDRYPAPPSFDNWLGTDDRGRDVFVRLIYGFRLSMILALFCLFVASFIGIFWGGAQGYFGGKIDLIAQRFVETWQSLPALFVMLLISHLFEPSIEVLLVCLAAFLWIAPQYYIRGECLKVKGATFVQVARSLGASEWRIFTCHVIPNALTPLITLAPFIMNQSILFLAFLDYLGLGVQAPTASLGELLRQGKENMLYAWWLCFYPLLTVTLTLLLLNFVGDGVRQAFDPKAS